MSCLNCWCCITNCISRLTIQLVVVVVVRRECNYQHPMQQEQCPILYIGWIKRLHVQCHLFKVLRPVPRHRRQWKWWIEFFVLMTEKDICRRNGCGILELWNGLCSSVLMKRRWLQRGAREERRTGRHSLYGIAKATALWLSQSRLARTSFPMMNAIQAWRLMVPTINEQCLQDPCHLPRRD